MTLRYNFNQVINNVGAIFASAQISPTFIYNLLGIGASSIPFFSAFSAIYRYYRVIGWTLRVSFTNLETTLPIGIYLCPTNNSVGANYATWNALTSNFHCTKPTQLPKSATADKKLTQTVTVLQFAGSKDTKTDDLYSGTTSGTSPTNNVYHQIGIFSPVGTVFVNGASVVCDIDVQLAFFEFASPST